MGAGHPTVEKIMPKIRGSIKEGVNHQNKQHYNVIYEAIWLLVEKIESLERIIDTLKEKS